MGKRSIDPARAEFDWIWTYCDGLPPAERLAFIELQLTEAVDAPAATAQWMLPWAVGIGDRELVAALLRHGARVKGTLFENLVHPDSLEIYPEGGEAAHRGPFNLDASACAALPIPTDGAWRSAGWDLDTPYAYEHFHGLSIDEAVDLIGQYSMGVSEDFYYMPDPCFRFYILAFAEYLLSPRSRHDPDAASAFITHVSRNEKSIAEGGELLRDRVRLALSLLATSQEWYDASRDIYGDFATRIARDVAHVPFDASESTS